MTPPPPRLQSGARCLPSRPPALSLAGSKSPSHQDHLCKHPRGLRTALVKRVIKCESLLLPFPHIVSPSCTSTSGITGRGGICFCCRLHWAVHNRGRILCPLLINHPARHGSAFCLVPCRRRIGFFSLLQPGLLWPRVWSLSHSVLTPCTSVICPVECCPFCFLCSRVKHIFFPQRDPSCSQQPPIQQLQIALKIF